MITASKEDATIPGSSSPGALSTTSLATAAVNRLAEAGSGATPSLRRSAVDIPFVSVCSVSATKPACACITLPAKR